MLSCRMHAIHRVTLYAAKWIDTTLSEKWESRLSEGKVSAESDIESSKVKFKGRLYQDVL